MEEQISPYPSPTKRKPAHSLDQSQGLSWPSAANAVELEGVSAEVEQIVDSMVELPDASKPSGRGEIIKSATLVMLGNLGSSLMGMLRQSFVASTGASLSGPFFGAISPAQEVQ